MTPALKAMVEAMAAELLRQGEAGDLAEVGFDPASSMFTAVGVNGGEFDLEKVDMAGLTNMREPTEAMVDAACKADLDIYWAYEAGDRPGGPDDVWRVMIDAILGENP